MQTQYMFLEHIVFLYVFGAIIISVLLSFMFTSKTFKSIVSWFKTMYNIKRELRGNK